MQNTRRKKMFSKIFKKGMKTMIKLRKNPLKEKVRGGVDEGGMVLDRLT